jgi:pimeloyl-ACP methyl ester carboxylesterase
VLPPPIERRQGAIVLVHGAWVGEWCWSPVLPLLEESGRPVHAVSLTGHGSRRHQSGPHVTLADHVADVIGALEAYDLTEVTLVGHSYAGRVITPAWEQARDRVARLVFLDAHAPVAPDTGLAPERIAEAQANGGMLGFRGFDPDPDEVGGPRGVRWFLDRVMPQLTGSLPRDLPKTYVFATGYSPSRFAGYAAAARTDPGWDYVELPGSHWLMFSHPQEVAEIVLR